MVTVSHLVKRMVDSRPAIQDALIEDIVNYSNLAGQMLPGIEAELGHPVVVPRHPQVVVALGAALIAADMLAGDGGGA